MIVVKMVYLDSAATTPMRDEVLRAMASCAHDCYANPSSPHPLGKLARQRLQQARSELAALLGCKADQLVFTSCGTESNNLALLGSFRVGHVQGSHVLVSAIEHKSVLEAAHRLQEHGAEVEYLPPDSTGVVGVDAVRAALRPNTSLVSVMLVNNEIGTVQPIEDIGSMLRSRGIVFHVDAVQALGKLHLDLGSLPVDLATLSAHKIEGPRGIGALYMAPGISLTPQLIGGSQESGLRAGTENVPAIVGFAESVRLVVKEQNEIGGQVFQLRADFEERLQSFFGRQINITGNGAIRSPHISNIVFRCIDSNYLLRSLGQMGICATAGSACQSTSLAPSHVLLAIGLQRDEAQSAVRFSFSRHNTAEDMSYTLDCLKQIHQQLGLADKQTGSMETIS